jgi:hypothetical protein
LFEEMVIDYIGRETFRKIVALRVGLEGRFWRSKNILFARWHVEMRSFLISIHPAMIMMLLNLPLLPFPSNMQYKLQLLHLKWNEWLIIESHHHLLSLSVGYS